LSGKKYGSTIPIVGRLGETPTAADTAALQSQIDQEKIDIAFRVIADHIRALSFAIADGIIPSNEGRGYVLRRILRRAVRYGRSLGFHEPFFFKLVDVVAKTTGDIFPEIRAKQKAIKDVIRREEEAFNKTLDKGIELFEARMASVEHDARKVTPLGGWVILPADFVFKLYDTYGFPLDLTELMARERGLTVDVAGFEKLMEEQRERARKAQKKETIEILNLDPAQRTEFVGYSETSTSAVIKQVGQPTGQIEATYIVPSRSPFYSEMGGQVSDTGTLVLRGQRYAVRDAQAQGKRQALILAEPLSEEFEDVLNQQIQLEINVPRRHAIERHHTATHLLHWALHKVVSRDASQKGSYVGPDKLTFDFSSAPLTKQQVRDVEQLVNEKITENAPVSWTEIPYAKAKKRSDIIQFFGEKYGDTVRVLQVGGAPHTLNGYSMELCGGTHVGSTGEIGPFRIVKEEAIAAGVRRIEAVAGEAARAWAKQEAARQQEKFEALARKKSDIAPLRAFENDASTSEMLRQIDERAAHLEKVEVEVRDWEKQSAKTAEAELRSRAAQIANELMRSHAGEKFCVAEVQDGDARLLQVVVDALKSKFNGPIFLVGAANESVALIASVPKEMTSKFQANRLIQQIVPIVGGKGGGRPENAQGAGQDPRKIAEALAKAKELLG
jgi:alanyl-tRNA synthetase